MPAEAGRGEGGLAELAGLIGIDDAHRMTTSIAAIPPVIAA